jgi:hypothetical protein
MLWLLPQQCRILVVAGLEYTQQARSMFVLEKLWTFTEFAYRNSIRDSRKANNNGEDL